MLKLLIVPFIIFLLISCEGSVSQNTKPQILVSQVKIPQTVVTEETERLKKNKRYVKEIIKRTASNFGLPSLADSNMPTKDLEARFYLFAGFSFPKYQDRVVNNSVLILKRTNENWSAKIIRDTIRLQESEPRPKKRISEELNPPTSNWESFWQHLKNEKVLSLSTGEFDGGGADTWLYVIETKVNDEYRFYHFNSPFEACEIIESRQVAKIFNLLAKEFNVADISAR